MGSRLENEYLTKTLEIITPKKQPVKPVLDTLFPLTKHGRFITLKVLDSAKE
jgi:hypothetical protein